ncbi:MAG TPA: ATP-binding protein [Gemmataceae bacterium]|nr:ATP-binding protein [Gemmataceae bacterium]
METSRVVPDNAALARRWQDLAVAAARIGHDFRNVLSGTMGLLQLALPSVPTSNPANALLHETLSTCRESLVQIERFELLGRRLPKSWRPAAALDVVSALVAGLELPEGVRIKRDLPKSLPRVRLDSESLQLALQQLLMNAVEACGDSGRVTIQGNVQALSAMECRDLYGAALPGQHVVITIADSGQGISPAVCRKIFAEPLFTTKANHFGLGLTLAFLTLHAFQAGFCLAPAKPNGTEARVYLPAEVKGSSG